MAATGATVALEVVVTAEATTAITSIETFIASSIVVAGITYTTSQVTTGAVIPDFANHLNYNYYGDNIWYTTEMPQNYDYDPLTGSGFEIPVDPILTPALPQSGAIEPLAVSPIDLIGGGLPKAGIAATKAVGSSIWSKIASGAMVTTGAIASKFGVKTGSNISSKLLNPPINKGIKQLKWIMNKHSLNQLEKYSGKSKFFVNSTQELKSLIQKATQMPIIKQQGGNLLRIVDAKRIIGIDAITGKPTSIYSVITNPRGDLITAFPGLPTY